MLFKDFATATRCGLSLGRRVAVLRTGNACFAALPVAMLPVVISMQCPDICASPGLSWFCYHSTRLYYDWYRNVQASNVSSVPEAPALSLMLYLPDSNATDEMEKIIYAVWVSDQREVKH